jgi:hypothetical protein
MLAPCLASGGTPDSEVGEVLPNSFGGVPFESGAPSNSLLTFEGSEMAPVSLLSPPAPIRLLDGQECRSHRRRDGV